MTAELLLVVGVLVVFYIIIGYPLLLAITAGRPAPPVRKDLGFQPSVSVILAVYNGGRFVRPKLESLLGQKYPHDRVEILVVSDGSTDGTDAIVESFADRGVRLLRVPHGGKASAINAALRHVGGEILFFTDVRQELAPGTLAHLAAAFADPTVGAVTGELQMLNPARAGEQADMELYWRYELWARRRHSAIDSTLVTTGCLYAIRHTLAEPIPPDTLTDDAILPLRVLLRGYRVVIEEQAVAYDYPTAEGGEFRRRLRTLAGLWQVHVRLPQIFTRANRMRFHFFSHKSARLVLPWAILLIWIATVSLPSSPFRTFLLVDELLFIALAVVDLFVPKWFPLKRISSPARTFLAMNLAAILSLAVFFVPPKTLWRPTRVKVRE